MNSRRNKNAFTHAGRALKYGSFKRRSRRPIQKEILPSSMDNMQLSVRKLIMQRSRRGSGTVDNNSAGPCVFFSQNRKRSVLFFSYLLQFQHLPQQIFVQLQLFLCLVLLFLDLIEPILDLILFERLQIFS